MNTQYRILDSEIGSKTTIENWPSQDLAGLVLALNQWTLDPRNDMSGNDRDHPHVRYEKPFRDLAWGHCVAESMPEKNFERRYVGTKPIHEGHPEAVRFCGNFLSCSFGFWIDTDDQTLIAELDRMIAENMARPEYIETKAKLNNRR